KVVVTNSGPGPASGIVVHIDLGDSFEVSYFTDGSGQGSFDPTTGDWDLGNLSEINSSGKIGNSRTLTIETLATHASVRDVTAEIIAVNETDPDSTPNNHLAGGD